MQQQRLRPNHLENSFAEKDQGILMDNMLKVSQQWALAAKRAN